MKGRLKARREGIILLAHQTEAMARKKRLRPVEDYLRIEPRIVGADPRLFAVMEAWQKKGLVTIQEVHRGAE